MPLSEISPFADVRRDVFLDDARTAFERLQSSAEGFACPLYLGFAAPGTWAEPVEDVDRPVDAFFGLQAEFGFEDRPHVLTFGLRASRFALILFWEALHVLRAGGLWIDIDETERLSGSSIGALDVLRRPYFAHALEPVRELRVGNLTATIWRKARPTLVAERVRERGWTFGILTAGVSPEACRMVGEIQAWGLPEYEILLCGPSPGLLADEANVRRIDLERPEPRGWITRKKNLIASEARHENLCLLHDRFRLPSNFAEAAARFGPAPGITTFPQLFFPEPSRTFFFRNVDYQVTRSHESMKSAIRLVNFRLDQFAYPQYNDWRETVHVNGGAYVTRRTLWRCVPQDEALYHGDWEDVVHGLACHRFGIPQRVNPHAVLESVTSHHSLLPFLSLPHLRPDGTLVQRRGFASAVFLANRVVAPRRLKPIGRVTERRLREQAAAVLPRLPEAIRAGTESLLAEPIGSLGAWWSRLARVVRDANPGGRAEAMAMLDFLWRCSASPVWHPNHVQLWLRGIELEDGAWLRLLDRQRRYFALWERLYPPFFESPAGGARATRRQTGPSARRRALQGLHGKGPQSRGLLWVHTSLGERPNPSLLPDDGEAVRWSVAIAARALLPLERILALGGVQRTLVRLARIDRRRLMSLFRPRETTKEP